MRAEARAHAGIRLPGGDSAELAQVAMRHRLMLLPGSNMSAEQRHGEMLRLPFLPDENELREGVRRMMAAWKGYRGAPRPRHFLQTIT